jgi:hypothetical protein
MFLHGLIYGTPETREAAAGGLGDIIALTSSAALKPFVIQVPHLPNHGLGERPLRGEMRCWLDALIPRELWAHC